MVDVDKIRAYIENDVKVWSHPSMAVGIIKDGEVVLADGFGYRNVEKGLKANADTLYQIGSCSKSFTSAAAALLVDRGLLEWDRPVHDYLPWIRFMDDYVTLNATTRDFLSHRTGLPRHDASWIDGPWTRRELVENLRNMKPGWPLRTHWNYQNITITAIGYLIEELTGMTWEEFVKKEFFVPLGMDRSSFFIEDLEEDENHARPYGRIHPGDKEGFKEIPFLVSDREDRSKGIGEPIGPAGSIISCVNDMLKWVQFHLNNGKVGDVQLVSEKNLKETHKPQMLMSEPLLLDLPETDFYSYGLCWFTESYRGHVSFEHGGNLNGMSALMSCLPDQNLASVILVNNNGARNTYSTAYMINDMFLGIETEKTWSQRFLEWRDETSKPLEEQMEALFGKPKEGTSPSHPLEDYVGTYHNACYGDLQIGMEDGHLTYLYNKDFASVKHFHYDSFQIDSEEALLNGFVFRFLTDSKGEVEGLSIPIQLDPTLEDEIFAKVKEKTEKEDE